MAGVCSVFTRQWVCKSLEISPPHTIKNSGDLQFVCRRNVMRQAGKKPKLIYARPGAVVPAREGKSHDDFVIYPTYQVVNGRFIGLLKVVGKDR